MFVEKPSVADRGMSFDYLTHDEVERLWRGPRRTNPASMRCTRRQFYVGARMGELYGLRWIDVNFGHRLALDPSSYRSTPKSGKARHVPINPRLAPVLRLWRDCCPASEEGLVFPSVMGCMRNKDRDYGFKGAIEGAGCHEIGGFHGLRHTFASHFMMRGGNILSLQRLLGHSSVVVTMKYAHLAPDFMREEIARMSLRNRRTAKVLPLRTTAPNRLVHAGVLELLEPFSDLLLVDLPV